MSAFDGEITSLAKSPAARNLGRILRILLATFLLSSAAFAADPAPASDFDGPPIEHDTLKRDPAAYFNKLIESLKEKGNKSPEPRDITAQMHEIVDHLDDFRKTFWETYPDKKFHDAAREAFAEALFLKDLQFLYGDLYIRSYPSANRFKVDDETLGSAAAGTVGALFTGSANLDGNIPQTALPEYADWFKAVRKVLRPPPPNPDPVDQVKSKFQVTFGVWGDQYEKACNFSGKEYQAYVMQRDWAEFDKANKIPAGYDNKQNYGIYLYYRNVQIPLAEAQRTYADMILVLGAPAVEAAVEKVLTAPKTPDQRLISKYKTPVKRDPSGREIPDNDVPMPRDIADFFTNQLVEMEALATQSDAHAYLLFLLKSRYFINQEHHLLDARTTKWSFAESTYKALCNAFGKKQVLDIAEKVRTAPKRQIDIKLMDARALGATRTDPIEAFEDILARSDAKGYVKAALAFNQNIKDPGSVDVDAAYKQLIATTDEAALLDAAKKSAAGNARIISANPRFAFVDELLKIKRNLVTRAAVERR